MIDQARWNLAQPIKFKFSSVLTKYYQALKSQDLYAIVFCNRLGQTISQSIIRDIPPIAYELVEAYWRKMYGEKDDQKKEPYSSVVSDTSKIPKMA